MGSGPLLGSGRPIGALGWACLASLTGNGKALFMAPFYASTHSLFCLLSHLLLLESGQTSRDSFLVLSSQVLSVVISPLLLLHKDRAFQMSLGNETLFQTNTERCPALRTGKYGAALDESGGDLESCCQFHAYTSYMAVPKGPAKPPESREHSLKSFYIEA